ncbi:MAG: hypothetical protein HEP70_12700 [Rhodobiaceae bacterium]|nr:hypothetical protein [Rhodobiaceae bacterium]
MDEFNSHVPGLESPATYAETVTPSDSVELAHISRAIYVGGTGDLAVTMKEGGSVTFKNVIGGTVLAIRVGRVLSSGTTATDIVGMY